MKRMVQLAALLFAVILVGAAAHANQSLLNVSAANSMMAAPSAALLAVPMAQNHPATHPNRNPNGAAPPPPAHHAHAKAMPKTASPVPEIGLIGLLALFGIGGVKFLSRKLS